MQGKVPFNRWHRPDDLPVTPHRHHQLSVEPQFPLEQIYFMPFRYVRSFNEEGEAVYQPLERNTRPTGIDIFDQYLNYLSAGNNSPEPFAKKRGIEVSELFAMVFILTGIMGCDFALMWRTLQADDLLRFTNLKLSEVARRSGIGTGQNLYYTYMRDHHCTPSERRRQIRQKGDAGRYAL